MAEMLSPGVFVEEIDASTIVPTVSSSVGVFAGNFIKGPVGEYSLVTSVDELISKYGKPTDVNYNDFYQAYNFLQYGNKLLISRASNVGGTATVVQTDLGVDVTASESIDVSVVTTADLDISSGASVSVGDLITIGAGTKVYMITVITTDTITLDRNIEEDVTSGDNINAWTQHINAYNYIPTVTYGTDFTEAGLVSGIEIVENMSDYELKNDAGQITVSANASLRFTAKNPGAWGNNIGITVAKSGSFGDDTAYAIEGVKLDDLFEYAPSGTDFAVIVSLGEDVVETFTVSLDESAKDYNNKSMFIETVINNQSSYVFVKANTTDIAELTDNVLTYDSVGETYTGAVVPLLLGADSAIQGDDLLNAYDVFANKEEIDIDIVIGNELNEDILGIQAVQNLVEARKDCIGFIGAYYSDTVGKKAADATTNLIEARKTGNFNVNSMFLVYAGNYKYQYDRYNDKFRWINIAGDIAGLRAQTSSNRASWWASAGLERGQIKNVAKLAFNPTQGHRDLLYKNGVNPICSFPGQGTVMWGFENLWLHVKNSLNCWNILRAA